jgi:serine/threonine protein phosphatase PrpC
MPAPYVHSRLLASDRRNSEDRVEVFERNDASVVVVADGAGGVRGGALASKALVETARAVTRNASLDVHDTALWTVLLKEVDATLAAKMAGETTGVVVIIGSKGLMGVSAGDSEAWIVTATSVDDLTMGQKKARLGSGRALPISFHRPGFDGVLVVGTDGLFRYATAERIVEALRGGDVERAAERLAALARLPSGGLQDDMGVVVIRSRYTPTR